MCSTIINSIPIYNLENFHSSVLSILTVNLVVFFLIKSGILLMYTCWWEINLFRSRINVIFSLFHGKPSWFLISIRFRIRDQNHSLLYENVLLIFTFSVSSFMSHLLSEYSHVVVIKFYTFCIVRGKLKLICFVLYFAHEK